jgi:regulator of sirC expression with transglutaminase-like and TPR domain
VVMDPFTGESLTHDDLMARIEPMRQQLQRADEDGDVPLALFLQTCASRDVVACMLGDLKRTYQAQKNNDKLLLVHERLVRLFPRDWAEVRDRGMVYAELGYRKQAVQDLKGYVDHMPNEHDVLLIEQQIHDLQKNKARH